jgi:hypothetical protein
MANNDAYGFAAISKRYYRPKVEFGSHRRISSFWIKNEMFYNYNHFSNLKWKIRLLLLTILTWIDLFFKKIENFP